MQRYHEAIQVKINRTDPPNWKKAIKAAGGRWNVHTRAWEVSCNALEKPLLQVLKHRIRKMQQMVEMANS